LHLTRKVASRIGSLEFCRVRVAGTAAEPLATEDNRLLATAVSGDGFVLIPENSEGHPAGAQVKVYLYDPIAALFSGDDE
jgi:molybdopterin molybdotransferase